MLHSKKMKANFFFALLHLLVKLQFNPGLNCILLLFVYSVYKRKAWIMMPNIEIMFFSGQISSSLPWKMEENKVKTRIVFLIGCLKALSNKCWLHTISVLLNPFQLALCNTSSKNRYHSLILYWLHVTVSYCTGNQRTGLYLATFLFLQLSTFHNLGHSYCYKAALQQK